MLLIFCMMIMLDVLNAHECFQNYLNHFCFDLEFSFMMIIYELWFCLWLLLIMKCIWWLILMWAFLGYVNMCLKLLCVEFQLMFWIFSPSLTLGFDLVVCCLHVSFDFRFKHPSSIVDDASSFGCWYLLLITNVCFVGWCWLIWDWLVAYAFAYWLTVDINCWLFVCIVYWFVWCFHRYISCLSSLWTWFCLVA